LLCLQLKPTSATQPNWVQARKEPHGKTQLMGTSLGLVRTHTAGAPGSGASKRSAFVDFEPGNFLRLYKTAHSESMVDKWDNFAFRPVAAG